MGVEIIENFDLFNSADFQTEIKNFALDQQKDERKLIKSKQRVQSQGEVFTPKWMVKKMLATPEIQQKLHDLHATFLEPSAGEGAFLVEILEEKLSYVDEISNKSNWKEHALWALMSIYGIEYSPDNVRVAKDEMMQVLLNHYQAFFQETVKTNSEFFKSASLIINLNIVQGNTLTYLKSSGEPIVFNEWQRLPDGLVQRKPFTYKSLFEETIELDLFFMEGQLDLFSDNLVREYKPVSVLKIYKGEI